MLQSLHLENFLLFENARFDFLPGLNAVSGETGAGKSLLARALGLALGGRGGADTIRSGSWEAVIEAVFSPGDGAPASARDMAGPDGRIVVRRTVRRDGGGMTVNGRAITAGAVRQTLAPLVDFAAQNEQMRLADPAHQLELLDAHGRLGAAADTYRQLYGAAESLARRLRAGGQERELVRLRLERAIEELAALAKADYDPKRDGGLEEAIREMSNAAGVVRAAAEAAGWLEGGEPGAVESVTTAWKTLDKMAEVSPRLAEAAGELGEALEKIQSALGRLASVPEEMEADPARLDAMIGRSEKLKALARRLECGVEALPAARERLEREVEELSGWDAGEDEIRARLAALLPDLAAAGLALGKKRREAAKRLARAVNHELAGLGMEQAGFLVDFEPLWSEGMPLEEVLEAGPAGLDGVHFFLSPNPGEAPSAIAGGASGGEASRALLAIKSALSRVYLPDVMFLDEVDAGVGARLGRELGVKLGEMARTRQIIVITHLPQIAAHAARHLKVAKQVRKGRTTARVEQLDGEERVREVASMIHGASAGDITLRQAREMLAEGGNG